MVYGDLEYRCQPERVALLIVDVQRDFCGPVTASGAARDNTEMDEMTGRLNGLIAAARAAAVPVVYARTLAETHTDSLVWRTRRGETYPYSSEVCKEGTAGAEMYCDGPEPGDVVVTKRRYDSFVGTDLDFILRAMQRESLVATGVLTDICVETAVRHAVSLDYFVAVAGDCCASFTKENHDAGLARIARAFGPVASATEIAAFWPAATRPGVSLGDALTASSAIH